MKTIRMGRCLVALLCLFYVVGGASVLSYRAVAGEAAGDDPALNKEDAEKKKKEKEERDKKEPPFKCSAWCAFKDISVQLAAPRVDPNAPPSDQTQLQSTQWEGFGRRGQWATVIVELSNLTKDVTFKGYVAVNLNAVGENSVGQIPYKTNYRKEFEVGPGGGVDTPNIQRIRFSVLCKEDWNEAGEQLQIEINAGSQSKVRVVNLKNLDATGEPFVVVVSDNEGALRYLTNQKRINPDDVDLDAKAKTRQVASVRPADFPTRWHDLTLANLIVFEGPPNDKLSDAQFDALKSYVQAGGHVLLMAGEDPSRLKGPWEELAGITVKGSTTIQSIDEIHPAYQDPSKTWTLPVIDVQIKDDARRNSLVKRNHKTGCVEMCRRFYGAGSVTFIPFSLNNPALKLWPGRETVPAQIIDRGAVSTLFGQANSTDIENSRNRPTGYNWRGKSQEAQIERTGLVNLRNTLDNSFVNDTPVQMQKLNTVLSFLLLYLLCAVPGNYFLFGWFRRREVAWLAIPVWAASFSVIAYAVGYMGQTGKLTVNELSVIEAGPREDVGISRTFFGVYAPQRDDYSVEFPTFKRNGAEFDVQAAPGHLVNSSSETSREDTPALQIVDTDQGLLVNKLLVQQRSTRRLEVVHRAKLGDGLDVKVKPNAADDKGFDIEIENNTGYELLNPVFVHEGNAIELSATPQMLPGAKNSLLGVGSTGGIAWKNKADAFFGKAVAFLSVRGKQSDNRTQALKEFLRDRVDQFRNGVVCAWIEEKPLPANIYNSRHQKMEIGKFEGLTLLLVPVGIKHGGQSSAQSLKTGPIPVRYALNYIQNGSTAARWQAAKPAIPLQLAKANTPETQGTNTSIVTLQFSPPTNAAELHNDGCYLRMHFKLAISSVEDSDAPIIKTLSGTLSISVEARADNNSMVWQELTNTMITGLQPDKPFKADSIDIPLGDYKLVKDNTMRVLIKTDTTEAPMALELRNLDIRVVEE